MAELKPCPFCGSHNVFTKHIDWLGQSFAQCAYCGASTGPNKDEQQAIDAWNKRS